jgi:hypothetical protein
MYFEGDARVGDEPMMAARTISRMYRDGESLAVSAGLNDDGVGGVVGAAVTAAKLSFTYPPDGDYTVKVENWARTDFYTVLSSDFTDGVLPLADYSAHYTVIGIFKSHRNTEYHARFAFDVELPEG